MNEGAVDPASLLEQIELQVGKVKEEALSRKEILDKVEKWMAACEEECWLEEYNNVGLPYFPFINCGLLITGTYPTKNLIFDINQSLYVGR